jgi:hypothetical protein
MNSMTSCFNTQVVQIVNNPLKIVKVTGKINGINNTLSAELVKGYLDLAKGSWVVTLDTYCLKVLNPEHVDTVFELSTPLSNVMKFSQENLRPSSDFATLGHIYVNCHKTDFSFGHFEKKYFPVDSPSNRLQIVCKAIPMTQQSSQEIDMELTILFQRQF